MWAHLAGPVASKGLLTNLHRHLVGKPGQLGHRFRLSRRITARSNALSTRHRIKSRCFLNWCKIGLPIGPTR